MKTSSLIIMIALMLNALVSAQEKMMLYPSGIPDSNGFEGQEQFLRSDFVVKISEPRMYYYPAPAEKANKAAVLICPGGGYAGVSVIKEGEEIARWFNNLGVTAFVLYYRMPNGHRHIPLSDTRKALEIIHSRSQEWNIKPGKVGILGFSAGGHLAATTATHLACTPLRPAFQILCYPVITMDSTFTHRGSRSNLLGRNPSDELVALFSAEKQVSPSAPPAFIFHAEDDKTVPVKNSQVYAEELKKMGVPHELHIFKAGGHGFGMRPTNPETDQWPLLLEKWLKQTLR